MASDAKISAKEAFIDDHFELAVDLYSQAIAMDPKNAELFADRAQANIKLRNFTEAVTDASRAIELDQSLSKAYLRKGSQTGVPLLQVKLPTSFEDHFYLATSQPKSAPPAPKLDSTACIKLEEYQTAKAALEAGALLTPGDSRFINLIKECDKLISEENGQLNQLSNQTQNSGAVMSVSELAERDVGSTKDAQLALASSKQKYRHEFYQKPEEVVVTVFAKGVPANSVLVDFGEQLLSITIDVPGEDAYTYQPRLFGKIVPAKCKYEVLSTKIEIRLAKVEALQWKSLEYSKEDTVSQSIILSSGAQRPSYPSSKPRKVDWEKLEAQMKKEEKEEKLDGDAALNKFFGEIYHDADEDTRRAMKKSFVESNGTVLSTNWSEVGSKMVEGSPPDGMEVKKWEY